MVLAFAASGCVPQQDFNRLKDKVNRLEAVLKDVRAEGERAARGAAQVEEVSKGLRKELASNLGALRQAQADQERRVEEMRREVQKLTGRVEEAGFRAGRAGEQLEKLRKEMGERLKKLEGEIAALKAPPKPPSAPAAVPPPPPVTPPGAAAPPKPAAPTPPKPPVAGLPPDAGREEAEYGAALRALREARQYGQARQMFRGFLKRYPKSELADNAQYWIGESYYVEGSYEKAILAFVEVQTRYPKGDKVPDALLKQALAFESLGDKRSARDLLRQVVKEHPNSNAAKIARGRLKGL
ncbi:MAG: tol-pal system protein YbgF [Nitrospinota bacterium]